MIALAFVAYDTPRPQGSKRHVGGGVMVESSKGLPTWREAVKHAALAAVDEYGWRTLTTWTPLGGDKKNPVPLFAKVVFTLARPASARRVDLAPCRIPDLSKLLRSTEDACTAAGVWCDDSRVTDYIRLAKVWTGYDDDALPLPGAAVAVGEAADEVTYAFAWLLRAERERVVA